MEKIGDGRLWIAEAWLPSKELVGGISGRLTCFVSYGDLFELVELLWVVLEEDSGFGRISWRKKVRNGGWFTIVFVFEFSDAMEFAIGQCRSPRL